MKRAAVITGRGAVSPVGRGVDALWRANIEGRSGVRPIVDQDLSHMPVCPVAAAFLPEDIHAIDRELADRATTTTERTLIAAIDEALDEAGIDSPVPGRVGLITCYVQALGNTTADFIDHARVLRQSVAARADRSQLTHLREHGPLSFCNAHTSLQRDLATMLAAPIVPLRIEATCATGLRLVVEGLRAIELGEIACVIIAAFAQRITPDILGGYSQMLALSRWRGDPALASRPFDKRRTGMVLADGAAALVIETPEHAAARGHQKSFGRFRGWGLATGLSHPTQPSLESITRVMSQALAHADIAPADVDTINTHGTGTKLNDLYEAQATRQIFAEHTDRLGITACKSVLGHSALPSAIFEIIVATCSMEHGILPPVPTCEELDPACELPVSQTAQRRPVEVVLKNAFGFGGHYGSLVLSRT